jgi:5-methylcytosine-specific restriction protein B
LEFSLAPGPLRAIAERAEANPTVPHLLVIDEINRGNIAKIFGELYFLLEYRNEPIQLQYSPQVEFRLPKNLYFIGTMNTADRSIALVDSALRRRFYFVGFFPREDSLRTVLRDWLRAHEYPEDAADLQATLNEALADAGSDEEFAIGHSYFMSDGPPDINRIWRRAIIPLLEERFYGARRRDEIEKEFGIDAIKRLRPQAADDQLAPADDDGL